MSVGKVARRGAGGAGGRTRHPSECPGLKGGAWKNVTDGPELRKDFFKM